MKYIVVLADGMADEPLEALKGRTPLDVAYTPTIDEMAPYSEIGLVQTIPEGCPKGSDTANLAVLGYDPKKYCFGRSSLEALSMRIDLEDEDITFRVNLVTLSDEARYEDKIMLDYSADEISSEEARILIEALQSKLGDYEKHFYPGISYRHLLVWHKGSAKISLMPPHDMIGKSIKQYKPTGENAHICWELMKESHDILKDHPINQERIKKGLKPANSIWLWGEGRKPELPLFKEKYGIEGAVISAVDLIKGIGIGAGMTSIDVEGVTGNVDTNYEGKARSAIKWLVNDDKDFIYIHLEGPDEAGHRGEISQKIKGMEQIDQKLIKPIKAMLDERGTDYKIMILPDHPTPIRLRTHTGEPVPYMIYNSLLQQKVDFEKRYTESYASKQSVFVKNGYKLIEKFLDRE